MSSRRNQSNGGLQTPRPHRPYRGRARTNSYDESPDFAEVKRASLPKGVTERPLDDVLKEIRQEEKRSKRKYGK